MFKTFVIIGLFFFVSSHAGGYDEPQESKPAAEDKHRGEGWVRGGQEESQNAAPEQEINHEWSFSGTAPKAPEAPLPPRERNDGPAPASYPALNPHGTNTVSYSGKGGYQEAPPAPAAAPAPPSPSAPAPQQSYKN